MLSISTCGLTPREPRRRDLLQTPALPPPPRAVPPGRGVIENEHETDFNTTNRFRASVLAFTLKVSHAGPSDLGSRGCSQWPCCEDALRTVKRIERPLVVVGPSPDGDKVGAVQLGPMKPTLRAPGTERLKLNYDKLLSNLLQICFQIQLAPLHDGRGHRVSQKRHPRRA